MEGSDNIITLEQPCQAYIHLTSRGTTLSGDIQSSCMLFVQLNRWSVVCGFVLHMGQRGLPPLTRLKGVGRQQPYGSKRDSLQAVELSQRIQTALVIVSRPHAPSFGGPIYRFLGKSVVQTRCMAGAAPHKSG